ncbi:MAG: SRPBCC family protein [Myxococcales bacterium]|nr:SRPBCC family protein [Myxococcales bacterium]MDH3482886.1 SRPBCC family protein [Myxococcales bacterium]
MSKTFFIGALTIGWIASTTATDVRAEEADAVLTAQIAEEGSSIAWGQAVVELDQPIDEVLPIVLDYANYVQFMPNFTRSRVLAQRGTRARVYMEVSIAKGAFTLWGQLNIAERAESDPGRVIEASLLEGNIDAFNARWELTPIDGGARTRVGFKIYVDPDIPLPSSIFSRENERAAGRTLRALRSRVAQAPQGST